MALTRYSRVTFCVCLLSHLVITEGLQAQQIVRRKSSDLVFSDSLSLGNASMWKLDAKLSPCFALQDAEQHAVRHNSSTVFTQQERIPKPSGIVPADLWGIHDLLLLGHFGVMLMGPHINVSLTGPSDALRQSRSAVKVFAGMLPTIHPVPKCRAMLKSVGPSNLEAFAKASWTCLGLSEKDFNVSFTSLSVDVFESLDAMNAAPKFRLGACQGSRWPRACSYWSSMHAMGVRADLLGKGKQFFKAMVQIISGGSLFCEGCTRHLRLLAGPILPDTLNGPRDFVVGV